MTIAPNAPYATVLQAPPSGPVIVVHLADRGLTACTGAPMPEKAGPEHVRVPRVLCTGCHNATLARQPRPAAHFTVHEDGSVTDNGYIDYAAEHNKRIAFTTISATTSSILARGLDERGRPICGRWEPLLGPCVCGDPANHKETPGG